MAPTSLCSRAAKIRNFFLLNALLLLVCKLPIMGFSSEKSHVTCQFKGELGNQLFEVAATIAFALDNNAIASFPALFYAMNGSTNYQHIFHRLNTSFQFEIENYHFEKDYLKYSKIEPSENLCLMGYFQSLKYFSHHENVIRDLFKPSFELEKSIRGQFSYILDHKTTVALHIRTFIKDGRCPEKDGFNGRGWDYFLQAMDKFSDSSVFLVFSDNIQWVKENFPETPKQLIFVENNPYYFDFYLMSFCNHQIISPGSTFSWWAAYLNPSREKIVVIPDRWAGREDYELFLENWIRIP